MSLVRRVTLTKAQRSTAAGQELIALLVDLSEDGMVTREEMERLRAWLEVDRGVDFAACPFLYEIVDQIASDGEITEEELDQLALGIERVLPSDVRVAASRRRRELREAKKREVMERRARERVNRDQMRARLSAARQHAKPLHRADYWVAGACRSEERREACEKSEGLLQNPLNHWQRPHPQPSMLRIRRLRRQGAGGACQPACS